jgi:predicted transcriptional regulator
MYNINNSNEVYKIYKLIKNNKGLFYSELLKISGKSKGTLSDQLKPLKDNDLITKEYNKNKKDYFFKSTLRNLKCPCCGDSK